MCLSISIMRKLVSIRKIKEVLAIKNADFIELVKVDGWQCIAKKGEFSVGDLGAYFEIDSFLPIEPEFEFLKNTKKMGEKLGYRLKSMRMREKLSEGLMLPLKSLNRFFEDNPFHSTTDIDLSIVGCDLTEWIGVEKYEAPIPAELNGLMKGDFPYFIPKTDQERIQNLFDDYSKEFSDNNEEVIENLLMIEKDDITKDYSNRIHILRSERVLNPIKNMEFEETLKLDGTSCTYYVVDIEKLNIKATEDMDIVNGNYFGHCSRNLETIEGDSTPWKIARDFKIKEKMIAIKEKTGLNFAFQGELMGAKIQGNRENLKKPEFYLFEIYNIDEKRYFTPKEREEMLKSFPNVKQVPILNKTIKPFERFKTIEEILEYAKGPSIVHKIREGIVFKSNTLLNGRTVSFKVINTDFLLKEK